MRTFTQQELNDAYAEEKYINDLHRKLVDENIPDGDTFWSGTGAEFNKEDGILIEGRVWEMTKSINGKPVKAYQIFQEHPNYNTSGQPVYNGTREEEILEKSEIEKVLNDCGDYRIVLLRNDLRAPTDTCWGYKFMQMKYAVIDNATNEVVFETRKKWLFNKTLQNTLKIKQAPDSLYEKYGKGKFKLKIIPLNDRAAFEHIFDVLGFPLDDLNDIIENYGKHTDNKYVVIIYGNGYKGYRYNHSENATYYIYDNIFIPEPTYDDVLKGVLKLYSMYDYNHFYEVLENHKTLGTDLNNLNISLENRIHYLVDQKVIPKIRDIFGLDKKSIREIFA